MHRGGRRSEQRKGTLPAPTPPRAHTRQKKARQHPHTCSRRWSHSVRTTAGSAPPPPPAKWMIRRHTSHSPYGCAYALYSVLSSRGAADSSETALSRSAAAVAADDAPAVCVAPSKGMFGRCTAVTANACCRVSKMQGARIQGTTTLRHDTHMTKKWRPKDKAIAPKGALCIVRPTLLAAERHSDGLCNTGRLLAAACSPPSSLPASVCERILIPGGGWLLNFTCKESSMLVRRRACRASGLGSRPTNNTAAG